MIKAVGHFAQSKASSPALGRALISCQIWQLTSFFPDRFGQTVM
jgi:hypothetical protein